MLYRLNTQNRKRQHCFIVVAPISIANEDITMICTNYNNKMKLIVYQSRAADEPPRNVHMCTHCPLDASKTTKALDQINAIQWNNPFSTHDVQSAGSASPDRHWGSPGAPLSTNTSTAHVLSAYSPASMLSHSSVSILPDNRYMISDLGIKQMVPLHPAVLGRPPRSHTPKELRHGNVSVLHDGDASGVRDDGVPGAWRSVKDDDDEVECVINGKRGEIVMSDVMVEITVNGDMMRRMIKHGAMNKEATLIGTGVDIVTSSGVESTVGFIVEGDMVFQSVLSCEDLCPDIQMSRICRYVARCNVDDRDLRAGYITRLLQVDGLDNIVTVMRRGRNSKGLIFFDNDPDDDTIFDLVKTLINLVGTVKNIRQLVSQEMFISLNNMSVRAFDIFKPPVDNYLYTSKPDGERLWLVKCGCMWLAVRNNRGGRVYGCVPAVKLRSACKLGPLIDAEMTLYGKVILIDMLINERSIMLRQDRNITQVIDHCNSIKSMMPFITIREYFDSYEDAANYAAQCDYAVDGVIGIRMTSMNTIKLKPSRSIELKVGKTINCSRLMVRQSLCMPTMTISMRVI